MVPQANFSRLQQRLSSPNTLDCFNFGSFSSFSKRVRSCSCSVPREEALVGAHLAVRDASRQTSRRIVPFTLVCLSSRTSQPWSSRMSMVLLAVLLSRTGLGP